MTEQEINEFFPPEFAGSNGTRGLRVFFDLAHEFKMTYQTDRFGFVRERQPLKGSNLAKETRLFLSRPQEKRTIWLDCTDRAVWERITGQNPYPGEPPYLRFPRVMSVSSGRQGKDLIRMITLRANYGLRFRIIEEFIGQKIGYKAEAGLIDTGPALKSVGVRLDFPVR